MFIYTLRGMTHDYIHSWFTNFTTNYCTTNYTTIFTRMYECVYLLLSLKEAAEEASRSWRPSPQRTTAPMFTILRVLRPREGAGDVEGDTLGGLFA